MSQIPIPNSSGNIANTAQAVTAPLTEAKGRPRMERAELLGQHTHSVTDGASRTYRINIFRRGASYLARGYYDRKSFGETLGRTEREAAQRLFGVLHEITQGSYVRRSEANRRPLAKPSLQQHPVRALIDEFLITKQKMVGTNTAADYRVRLTPLVEFAERPDIQKRWRVAATVNNEFAVEFRQALISRQVNRNGHAASSTKIISSRHVYNCLDVARSLFNWAKDLRVAKLPAWFINPFTEEIVGQRPRKDPFREPLFPLPSRTQLVACMDTWQLAHLALSITLPVRPEDCMAILVRDVNFETRLIQFGTRFDGRDFNKGRVSFRCPYPEQLDTVLGYCRGERADGPLLRARSVFEGRRRPVLLVENGDAVLQAMQAAIGEAPAAQRATFQDQKKLVRRAIRQMGGVTGDELAKEFKRVLTQANLEGAGRFYDLRAAITTELNRSGVSHLAQRYVTGHTTSDILNEYVALDPIKDLQKYFKYAEPLLEAIADRARELGIKS